MINRRLHRFPKEKKWHPRHRGNDGNFCKDASDNTVVLPAMAGTPFDFLLNKEKSIPRQTLYFLAVAFFLLAIAVPTYASEKTKTKDKDLGSFGTWHAYAYEEGGQLVCYMMTSKSIKTPKSPKKRTAYLMITHRPIEASIDVFSYSAGLPLDPNRKINVKIGVKTFELFSARDTAWARDTLTDHKIGEALRLSSEAQTMGFSTKRTRVSDRFSLSGSMAAYRAINKACGLPVAEPPPKASKKPTIKKKDGQKPKLAKKTVVKKKAPAKAKKSQ